MHVSVSVCLSVYVCMCVGEFVLTHPNMTLPRRGKVRKVPTPYSHTTTH